MKKYRKPASLFVPVLLLSGLTWLSAPALAAPCKADGEVCRTSRSCCGTSGNNGVCVKATGAKFGSCCTKTNTTDTTCDGVDDDCNGLEDDGYVSLPTSCGTGTCAATGSTSCVNGQVVDSCTPGTPDCAGSECGDDGCGGSCGTCTPPAVCGGGAPPHLCEIPFCAIVDLRCTCTNENVTCHAACSPPNPVAFTCDEARTECARVCAEHGGVGPGDCLTRPCTDCATGEQCP